MINKRVTLTKSHLNEQNCAITSFGHLFFISLTECHHTNKCNDLCTGKPFFKIAPEVSTEISMVDNSFSEPNWILMPRK